MWARSCATSIPAPPLLAFVIFLFFEPGGRPRRFAFFAINASNLIEGGLIGRLFDRCRPRAVPVSIAVLVCRGEASTRSSQDLPVLTRRHEGIKRDPARQPSQTARAP